jgi:hypothetical protein
MTFMTHAESVLGPQQLAKLTNFLELCKHQTGLVLYFYGEGATGKSTLANLINNDHDHNQIIIKHDPIMKFDTTQNYICTTNVCPPDEVHEDQIVYFMKKFDNQSTTQHALQILANAEMDRLTELLKRYSTEINKNWKLGVITNAVYTAYIKYIKAMADELQSDMEVWHL